MFKKLIITLLLGIISLVGFNQPTYEDDYTKEAITIAYHYISIYNSNTDVWEQSLLEQRNTFVFYPNNNVILQYREYELIDRYTILSDTHIRDVNNEGEEYIATKVINSNGNTEIIQIFGKAGVLREILNGAYIEYKMKQ